MPFFTILGTLNFEFLYIWAIEIAEIYKNLNSEPLKLEKKTIFELPNLWKLISRKSLSSSKIIKFQQSEALTSHFESFWSIVRWVLPY